MVVVQVLPVYAVQSVEAKVMVGISAAVTGLSVVCGIAAAAAMASRRLQSLSSVAPLRF